MKRYFPLFALTLAFLGALLWLAVRGGNATQRDHYSVATARSVPAEDLVPEKQLIDINTATADQLEELMGVGPVLAQAIVDYRTEHGPFRSVDELLRVSGIGESKLDSIRDDVTTGGEG